LLFFNNKARQDSRGPRILVGSEKQRVFNVNLQLFANTVRGCGALQVGVEGATTIVATTTRCIYVATTNSSSGLKDFSGSLMC
jgi:hypothetical protein